MDVVDEEEPKTTLKNNLPWTVIKDTGANSNKMHTIQLIDGVTVGRSHLAIRDLDDGFPNAPWLKFILGNVYGSLSEVYKDKCQILF